jgi:hypothetical protein
MAWRIKVLIGVIVLAAPLALLIPAQHWLLFAGSVAAVVLSEGMKVSIPKGESTMSVNFPFILSAIVQLSPRQAMAVAAISVFAQCKFQVEKLFACPDRLQRGERHRRDGCFLVYLRLSSFLACAGCPRAYRGGSGVVLLQYGARRPCDWLVEGQTGAAARA